MSGQLPAVMTACCYVLLQRNKCFIGPHTQQLVRLIGARQCSYVGSRITNL